MYASTADVGTLMQRPLTDAESQAAAAWLSMAEAMVGGRFPNLASLATVTGYATTLRWTLATAVARVLRNPDGKVSETIDDYSYRRAEAAASGGLFLTDDEWARLTPGEAARTGGAFTIRPRRPM